MLYTIARNGQTYGPYTLEELTRYVGSGHVLPSDMARGEGTEAWVPVSALVGASAGSAPPPAYGSGSVFGVPLPGAYPAAPAGPQAQDAPPNLHWALVLLFATLTCTFFMYIWNLIVALWANRIAPGSKVLPLYIGATVMAVIQGIAGSHMRVEMAGAIFQYPYHGPHFSARYIAIACICWVVRLVARFTMRNTLLQHYNTVEPIGLRLSGVMTFFFGGVYFQYHLNRINELKRRMVYGGL